MTLTTDLAIADGGTGSSTAGAALTALGAAASGANSDITSLTGLTTDLTVAQGGTGAGTFTANGLLIGNGTGAVTATAVGTATHVLTSNGVGVAPTFQAAGGGGATDIDGLSDAITNSSGTTVGLGTGALASGGSTSYNTALGYEALNDAIGASQYNVAVGYQAGHKLTTGTGNVAIGSNSSLPVATTGSHNVVIGEWAGYGVTTASKTIIIGNLAGGNITTADDSIFIGYYAGGAYWYAPSLTGQGNIGIGYYSSRLLTGATTGSVAVGPYSLETVTTGSGNTGIGNGAGSSITTGTNNTCLGGSASGPTTGSNNTILGYQATESSNTVSNEITLGNTSVDKFRIPGINFTVKDTTATDNYVLTVDANGEAGWEAAAAGGATDINGLSDALTNSSGATIGLGTGTLGFDDGTTNYNTALGYQALPFVTSGSNNVGIGKHAGYQSTTPIDGVYIGFEAASAVTTQGGYSVALGSKAARNCTDMDESVIIGYNTAANATDASGCVFVGSQAGMFNGGSYNVGIGPAALYGVNGNAISYGNTAVGLSAMRTAKNGAIGNTAVGAYTLDLVDGGDYNTVVGYDAGDTITTGNNNTVIGNGADASSATVSNEITLGNTAVTKFRIPGIDFVLKDNGGTPTTGQVLTADGSGEGYWAAAAGGATDIDGLSDGVTNSSGFTVGLGLEALSNDDGGSNKNTALGYQALKATNSNFQNTAVGYNAGTALIGTGDANYGRDSSLFGYRAGALLTTGRSNAVVGANALDAATTPDGNTAIGTESGGAVTTGANNVFVGRDAGYTTTTGSNNIILGGSAQASSATVSNEITLGNSSISSLRCQVQTISTLSDRRDKKDIEELPLGIDFINTLKPVKFTWNMRDGAKVGQQEAGFIAQDLDEAQIDAGAEDYLSLVLKNNPEKLEASYGKLVPVLVKAVQELSAEVATLKKEIENGK